MFSSDRPSLARKVAKRPYLNLLRPRDVPTHISPRWSRHTDLTRSPARPCWLLNVVNFPPSHFDKPPPSVPIHRLPSRSWHNARTPFTGNPSAPVTVVN